MRILLFTMLATCHAAPKPTATDNQAMSATVTAWQASGLPGTAACLKDVGLVRHYDQASFNDLKRCYITSAGCTLFTPYGIGSKEHIVIHIAPKYVNDEALVQHETLHIMTACYLNRDAVDVTDKNHTDPRVWEAVGGVNSVQYKARQSL